MKNIKNKLLGNVKILPVLVFALIIFAIIQSIFLIKLTNAAKQGNIMEEADKEFEEKFGVPDDFFKHFDSNDWDPMEEFKSMRQRMDRMFDDSHNRMRLSPFFNEDRHTKGIMPQTNLEEKDDRYIISMNIPGSDKAEIKVNLEDDTLVVSAKTKKESKDEKGTNYLRMERNVGSFYRSLVLPGPVDEGAMDTKYEDGVLTIVLPKQG